MKRSFASHYSAIAGRCARSSGENLLMPFKALFFCLPMLFASTVMAQEAAEKPATMRSPAASVPVEPENVLALDLSDGGRVRNQLRPELSPNTVRTEERGDGKRGVLQGRSWRRGL